MWVYFQGYAVAGHHLIQLSSILLYALFSAGDALICSDLMWPEISNTSSKSVCIPSSLGSEAILGLSLSRQPLGYAMLLWSFALAICPPILGAKPLAWVVSVPCVWVSETSTFLTSYILNMLPSWRANCWNPLNIVYSIWILWNL